MSDEKSERKYVTVWLKLNEENNGRLKQNAKTAHMSVSQYVMFLVENKPIYVISDLVKFVVQLKRMGGNINQIATVVNAQKYADYPMRKVLRDTQKELEKMAADINKILLFINCPTERTLSEKETELLDMLGKIEELSGALKEKIKVGG